MNESKQLQASVRATDRSLMILSALAGRRQPSSATEIAALAGLHLATAYRFLNTMVRLGWVEQDAETGRYRIGPKAIAVGAAGLANSPLIQHGREFLQRAAEALEFSAYLSVLVEARVVHLAWEMGKHGRAFGFQPGISYAAHAGAPGKLLLAYLSAGELDRVLTSAELTAFTPHTITERESLEAEFDSIRAQGWARDSGEHFDFLRGIAVPVLDSSGTVIASLSTNGRIELSPESEQFIVQELTVLASELSLRLGFHEGYQSFPSRTREQTEEKSRRTSDLS